MVLVLKIKINKNKNHHKKYKKVQVIHEKINNNKHNLFINHSKKYKP